ncbi:LAMI_0G08262g1_1 [Lachancea mirantina]|uniref:LAMI_0G08262g1_1 n=1 Tax=Lachancea mirantina TaxID=1230905 RepID=A0A1G4K9T6_9SACH|nr:LAMI_0G08262g1_1 [Lachancea mirantina]
MLRDYKPLAGSSQRRGFPKRNVIVMALFLVLLAIGTYQLQGKSNRDANVSIRGGRCNKIDPLAPSFDASIEKILEDSDFKSAAIERLSKAIQIPTEIQDVNPMPADNLEYYAKFFEFHAYLEKSFPLVHKHLSVEKVNEVGLVYSWAGKDDSLKPVLFMAHQDVVPVNRATVSQWDHPPFSGYYDSESDTLWGRGTADCKNLLIAELAAVELLLEDGYEPVRSVVLSFGFDEESSGVLGAKYLGKFLHERYGDDGLYAIVDEGGPVVELEENVYIATPITGEKGYVDSEITIHGVGGHSSVPPDHTTIGVAAALISTMESRPFDSTIGSENPLYGLLTCAAEHSNKLPSAFKSAILNSKDDPKEKQKLVNFISQDARFKDLIKTSQAADIINGGVKANALPEVTSFLVNHRIELQSSVNATLERDLAIVKEIAHHYGYGVKYEEQLLAPATELGYIELRGSRKLEPAPISPTHGPVWDVFAGTIQNVFEKGVFIGDDEKELYVTTALFSGNTDTKYYWPLTKNIYRFFPMIGPSYLLKTVHSVNEHIPASAHLSAIAFIYEYIVNTSENV